MAAYDPAERAELIEHGTAAHSSIETGAHLVAWKRQHDLVTTPFIYFAHDTDARHELVVYVDVDSPRGVCRRTSAAPPIAECGNPLIHLRREGIDPWRPPVVRTIQTTCPRTRGRLEESQVRTGMSNRRNHVPNHILNRAGILGDSLV